MRKKAILCALGALLLLLPFSALAADLPINIDAIGQMDNENRREAVTARFGIDLFSPTADEVNRALVAQRNQRREAVATDLFEEPHAHQTIDVEAQILRAAQDSALFAQPMQVTRAVSIEVEESFSMWLIAAVLLGSAGIGFLIARAMTSRKERKEHVSHVEY